MRGKEARDRHCCHSQLLSGASPSPPLSSPVVAVAVLYSLKEAPRCLRQGEAAGARTFKSPSVFPPPPHLASTSSFGNGPPVRRQRQTPSSCSNNNARRQRRKGGVCVCVCGNYYLQFRSRGALLLETPAYFFSNGAK